MTNKLLKESELVIELRDHIDKADDYNAELEDHIAQLECALCAQGLFLA